MDETQRAQLPNLPLVDGRLEAEIKLFERFHKGQMRQTGVLGIFTPALTHAPRRHPKSVPSAGAVGDSVRPLTALSQTC